MAKPHFAFTKEATDEFIHVMESNAELVHGCVATAHSAVMEVSNKMRYEHFVKFADKVFGAYNEQILGTKLPGLFDTWRESKSSFEAFLASRHCGESAEAFAKTVEEKLQARVVEKFKKLEEFPPPADGEVNVSDDDFEAVAGAVSGALEQIGELESKVAVSVNKLADRNTAAVSLKPLALPMVALAKGFLEQAASAFVKLREDVNRASQEFMKGLSEPNYDAMMDGIDLGGLYGDADASGGSSGTGAGGSSGTGGSQTTSPGGSTTSATAAAATQNTKPFASDGDAQSAASVENLLASGAAASKGDEVADGKDEENTAADGKADENTAADSGGKENTSTDNTDDENTAADSEDKEDTDSEDKENTAADGKVDENTAADGEGDEDTAADGEGDEDTAADGEGDEDTAADSEDKEDTDSEDKEDTDSEDNEKKPPYFSEIKKHAEGYLSNPNLSNTANLINYVATAFNGKEDSLPQDVAKKIAEIFPRFYEQVGRGLKWKQASGFAYSYNKLNGIIFRHKEGNYFAGMIDRSGKEHDFRPTHIDPFRAKEDESYVADEKFEAFNEACKAHPFNAGKIFNISILAQNFKGGESLATSDQRDLWSLAKTPFDQFTPDSDFDNNAFQNFCKNAAHTLFEIIGEQPPDMQFTPLAKPAAISAVRSSPTPFTPPVIESDDHEIPAEMEEKLLNAETEEEMDKAVDELGEHELAQDETLQDLLDQTCQDIHDNPDDMKALVQERQCLADISDEVEAIIDAETADEAKPGEPGWRNPFNDEGRLFYYRADKYYRARYAAAGFAMYQAPDMKTKLQIEIGACEDWIAALTQAIDTGKLTEKDIPRAKKVIENVKKDIESKKAKLAEQEADTENESDQEADDEFPVDPEIKSFVAKELGTVKQVEDKVQAEFKKRMEKHKKAEGVANVGLVGAVNVLGAVVCPTAFIAAKAFKYGFTGFKLAKGFMKTGVEAEKEFGGDEPQGGEKKHSWFTRTTKKAKKLNESARRWCVGKVINSEPCKKVLEVVCGNDETLASSVKEQFGCEYNNIIHSCLGYECYKDDRSCQLKHMPPWKFISDVVYGGSYDEEFADDMHTSWLVAMRCESYQLSYSTGVDLSGNPKGCTNAFGVIKATMMSLGHSEDEIDAFLRDCCEKYNLQCK